jgi:predicted transcriptional regulator
MQSTLKMSTHKPLIQPNQTSATKLAQKELLAEKADANVAKAAENVAIAVSVATTTILDTITLLKTQRILDLPKVS